MDTSRREALDLLRQSVARGVDEKNLTGNTLLDDVIRRLLAEQAVEFFVGLRLPALASRAASSPQNSPRSNIHCSSSFKVRPTACAARERRFRVTRAFFGSSSRSN